MARVIVAMERHHAFLKGAIGIAMTPVLKEDDVILSDMAGLDTNIACRLGVSFENLRVRVDG
jgi:hypothetical protein